ncbi:hypothetical protein D9757_000552 [Collybiopsis confluens]|uniref:Uncharacterized protein n=1 Tax=Collybiopsis confluens TaxID=2823264 RepID=A0A8H5I1Z2_9AGAR|nr:hypothetical protein D9757_000552 [Collybiopsis confluens]
MSSLSSVVSNLVRASMGTSVSPSVTDEELDKHVRDLLIKDAKKRAERYGQQGIRAYLASGLSDSNAPKANKRFLSSVIKSTDEHNKAVLRAQALSAEEINREKREQEMKERRARAEEAVQAEKMRRSGSSRRTVRDTESWDKWDGATGDRKGKRKRNWETWSGGEDEDEQHHKSRRRRSHRSRSRDGDRRSSRRERSRERRAGSSKTHTHSDRSSRHDKERSRRSPSVSSSREHHSRSSKKHRALSEELRHSQSPTPPSDRTLAESSTTGDRESMLRKKLKSKSAVSGDTQSTEPPLSRRSPSPELRHRPSRESRPRTPKRSKPSRSSPHSSQMSISRSPTPGAEEPGPALPSKMDKYFEESYDPRLDVTPLSTTPKVPATGLIDSAEFEGWDAMLDLLRTRKEDKAEKKRLERMGLSKDNIHKAVFGDANSGGSGTVNDRWSANSISIMDIQYKKRGSVREWDMGKEGF